MKIAIFILFMILIISTVPVSADLFGDMYQKIPVYNQNANKVPGVIKTLLGNEEMQVIIDLKDGTKLEVKAVTEDAKIIQFVKVGPKIPSGKGDCNKDGAITSLDALCALKMSVGKMPEDQNLDVDTDMKVSSSDATKILQGAVKLSPEVNPTVLVKTNENTVRNIMGTQKPADAFLDAMDKKDILIEGKGIVKSIVLSIGTAALKIARSFGIGT
ncbi:MAG: dockerin type I domain-containing protein [Candidatus Methanoperedens sp.]